MKQRLFNFAAALSLISFSIMVALWVTSQSQFRELVYYRWFEGTSPNLVHAIDSRLDSGGGTIRLHVEHVTIDDPQLIHQMTIDPAWQRNRAPGPKLKFSEILPGTTSFVEQLKFKFAAGVDNNSNNNLLRVGIAKAYLDLLIPDWAITITVAIPAMLWYRRRVIRQRRLKNQLCGSCAYDLRASKDRCPECGQPIPPASEPNSAAD